MGIPLNRIFLLLLLVPAAAFGEALYVTVPGEGWTLKLNAPSITSARGTLEGRRFQFMGSSVESGITLSLHSETEGSKSNDECRDTFWSRGKANPNIVKGSVTQSSGERAAFVNHLSERTFQGKPFKTANGHAYFVRNGLCMDLHVSHYPYVEGSEKQVDDVLRSVAVVQ